MSIVDELYGIIVSRKDNAPEGSYTAALFAKGEDEIVKKVGEEAIELIVAAKGQGRERLTAECADLVYHMLVLLAANDVSWAEVEAELARRKK